MELAFCKSTSVIILYIAFSNKSDCILWAQLQIKSLALGVKQYITKLFFDYYGDK